MESWACKELSGPVWSSAGGRFPAPGVYEMDCDCVARLSRDLLDGNRLFADRFVSHRQPLLPLKGGLWLLVGVEQKLTTDRTLSSHNEASVLVANVLWAFGRLPSSVRYRACHRPDGSFRTVPNCRFFIPGYLVANRARLHAPLRVGSTYTQNPSVRQPREAGSAGAAPHGAKTPDGRTGPIYTRPR